MSVLVNRNDPKVTSVFSTSRRVCLNRLTITSVGIKHLVEVLQKFKITEHSVYLRLLPAAAQTTSARFHTYIPQHSI